jgi:predicted Ser/Thr protein kinase
MADEFSLRHEVEQLRGSREQERGRPEAHAPPRAPLAHAPEPLASGQRVGRFEVLRRLGAGGMGEVYLARDAGLGRTIALKVLRSGLARDGEPVRRFLQEARAAGALNHPYICAVYELGQTDDARHFIAMEHIEGKSLRQVLAAGPLSLQAAVSVVRQASKALSAAHEAGIVHRDIKPENLMLRPDGYLKVLDFGLAKLMHAREGSASERVHTAMGVIMGTLHYMSPEQAQGLAMDARTDVWSLGAVLYELLTGRLPFEGETTWALLSAIMLTEPTPLRARVPGTPTELERIVCRALSKAADERYPSAGELAWDLLRVEKELAFEGWGPDTSDATSGEMPTCLRGREASHAGMAVSAWGTTVTSGGPPAQPRADAECPRPPTNLSDTVEPLVGRERELEEIAAKLRRDEVRLVTLSEPGGTGKTRLAQTAARALLESFPDGVFFVDLAPIREPALVAVTIALELGLKAAGGGHSPMLSPSSSAPGGCCSCSTTSSRCWMPRPSSRGCSRPRPG